MNKNNNSDKNEEVIIKSVFKNVYLLKLIYSFVRLYNNNEIKEFKSKNELLEYKEREYISNLIYNVMGILEIGDLPINGVLKQVTLNNRRQIEIKQGSIPYGVEIISTYSPIQLSMLPSTIHTIKYIDIKQQQQQQQQHLSQSYINDLTKIPPNITSISFKYYYSIDGLNKNSIIIPNTIKSLEFHVGWNNLEFKLLDGEIPNSVTSLHIPDLKSFNLKKGILPNSIKELSISHEIKDDQIDTFEFLPDSIESLSIGLYNNMTEKSNLFKFKKLKKLEISGYPLKEGVEILINSLPEELEQLKISYCAPLIEANILPINLKHLEISFCQTTNHDLIFLTKNVLPKKLEYLDINKFFYDSDILPLSLTNLDFSFVKCATTQIRFNQMISTFSTINLKSIIFPICYKDLLLLSQPLTNKIKFI